MIRLPFDLELFELLYRWQKARFANRYDMQSGGRIWQEELVALDLATWLLNKIGPERIEEYFEWAKVEAEQEVENERRAEREASARRKAAEPWKYRKNLPPRKRKRIFERDGYRCLECGSQKNLCIDHIVPLRKGGTDDDDNLRCLCQSCNLRRTKKTLKIDQPPQEAVQ